MVWLEEWMWDSKNENKRKF